MPEILLTTPDGQTRSVRLKGERVTLGRSQENTLCFPDDDLLSRRHLFFEREGERWTVHNLGSKNGTFVNGIRISSKHYLASGDKITAGALSITYLESGSTVTFDPAPLSESMRNTERISLKEMLAEGVTPQTTPGAPVDAVWAFLRAGRAMAERRPLPELFRLILDLSMEAVGAERGVLLVLDESDRLVVQASSGGEFRISAVVRDRVLRERASLLVEDVAQSEFMDSMTIFRQGIHSLMAVPLQTDDRVIGLLYMDSAGSRRSFTSADLTLLTVMANVASIRIEREQWESQRRALISENIATLERLAAALSHELNSPLGALKSTFDTLGRVALKRESASTQEQPRLADLQTNLYGTVTASIERMQQAIRRVQRLANLDRAEIQPVDLNALLGDLIAVLVTDSAADRVKVELRGGALPPVVCRAPLLRTALSSVLANAVEACCETGRPGRVLVSTRAIGGMVEVRVEDNGRGIPPEELPHVFEPSFRIVEGRVATGNWSLFSARQIVRQQGGEVRISSEPNRGSTVLITLPPQSQQPFQ